MKLPEPEITLEWDGWECKWEWSDIGRCANKEDDEKIVGYTADQMRQMRIDTLEEAALACEKKNPYLLDQWSDLREYAVANTVIDCATTIRALKGEET